MSKTVRNVAFVTIGVVLAQALGTLRSFILARLITPGDYGIWTTVQTIISLAPIACLGTVEALLKQVPYYRGKHDAAGLRRVEDTVFGTMVIAAGLIAVVLVGGGPFLPSQFVRENLVQVQLTAVAACVSFFTLYYYNRCVAYENFKLVSILDLLRSLNISVCVVLCAWRWGLLGASAGYLTAEVLSCILVGYLCTRAHGRVRVHFESSLMWDAVRVGFPITVIWWIYAVHASVGRFTSTHYLGNVATGYYGAGGSLAMLIALVPNVVGRVFYPRINAQLGANASQEAIRRTMVTPTAAITLVQPAAQAAIFFMLPVIYTYFIPKYLDGIACAQILIVGAFFASLIRNGSNYMIAAGLQWRLMTYVLVSVVANLVMSLAFVKLGWGINGIAIAAVAASALLGVMIWQRVLVELKYTAREQLQLQANFYYPFAATLLAIGAVHYAFQITGRTSLQWLGLQMVLALGLSAVLILLFPGTRALAKELLARAMSIFASRFKPAEVSLQSVPAERIDT